MTPRIVAARDKLVDTTQTLSGGGVERCVLVVTLIALAMLDAALRDALLTALCDAYLQVGVFVAATFAFFFWLESVCRVDTERWLVRHRAWEVPVASALGALPGCGGAVMVITQFAMGRASFGAVVAVLTSTMGDAAFLMLARRPDEGLLLIATGFVTGALFGRLVNALHGPDFMRVQRPTRFRPEDSDVPVPAACWSLWTAVVVPGLVIGILLLSQVDVPQSVLLVVGTGGGLLSIFMWSLSPTQATHMAAAHTDEALVRRVALNTNFVTVWVVIGFLVFELAGGASTLKPMFSAAPALLPLLGVLVGFLPGCGPQILVTTLYLAGALPFSAQLGNAISNDGDALFPAIAVAPKVAMVATLYTALPALLLGYGYYWAFE